MTTLHLHDRIVLPRPSRSALQTVAGALGAVRDTMWLWRSRIAARDRLRTLDAALLRDIGITEAEAFLEARKPFWRA